MTTSVRLFVYGTLAPGGEAWHLLEPHAFRSWEATVEGQLYDTGKGYPAARFGSKGVVHGWVVEVDAAALVELDRWEGPEYKRLSIGTTWGYQVEAYAWVAPLTGCVLIPGGRWPI